MRECQTFARDPILAKVDCMVLALLSHGTADNVISGTDGIGIHEFMKRYVPFFQQRDVSLSVANLRCISLMPAEEVNSYNCNFSKNFS